MSDNNNWSTTAAHAILRQLNNEETILNDQETTTTTTTTNEHSQRAFVGAILSNICLFGLIFGLSGTVEIKHLKQQLRNTFAILTGVAMQFLCMPLLGYLAVTIFGSSTTAFTHPMGIVLLVVTASPGGSYSNWWCSTFNADLALSVAMTTVSSLLSIALLPCNLFFYTWLSYGNSKQGSDNQSILQSLDFKAIFFTLTIVLSAILMGLLAGYKYDTTKFHKACNRLGSMCGLLLIIFSLFMSSGAEGADAKIWNMEWSFYVAVAFPCLIGMALANIIARTVKLSKPETVAIAIECCYQNTGIATSVALTMFTDTEDRAQAVAVPLFYGIVEAVVIAIYCIWAWKAGFTKAPPNEKLCVVVSKTYEVEDDSPVETDDELDLEESLEESDDDDNKPQRKRVNTDMTAETDVTTISSRTNDSATPRSLPETVNEQSEHSEHSS